MSGSVLASACILAAAIVTGLLTYAASRRETDDSRALGLINAGQVSLEAGLKHANEEIERLNQQVTRLHAKLDETQRELANVLELHANCERQRAREAAELTALRVEIGRRSS